MVSPEDRKRIKMLANKSVHLSKVRQIQLGSYYTPEILVKTVFDFISPFAEANRNNTVIFDNAAGCGAFISCGLEYDYRAADYDSKAVDFLKTKLPENKVFYSNSLKDVNRQKYNIPEKAFLIQIGNPPYNDTTSEFKNGQKGFNECDSDLFDRDLGVSFLKSFNKLKADIVCVLHPLSYLIKQSNFNRLKEFRENYKLIKGLIFSSSIFPGTGSTKFPIVIALYQKDSEGMNFEYINQFKFDILDSNQNFILSNYKTTDGYIDKYPARKNHTKISPIGLYYYTFRDLNSLKRSASFQDKPHYNAIVITVDNFYKYAYLYAIKTFLNHENIWLYGNLSPLLNIDDLEQNKQDYVIYALNSHPIFKKLSSKVIEEIKDYYCLNNENFGVLFDPTDIIKNRILSLV